MKDIRFHQAYEEQYLGFLEAWINENEDSKVRIDPSDVVVFGVLNGNVIAVARLTRHNRMYMSFSVDGNMPQTYRCFRHFESWCMMNGLNPVMVVSPDSPLFEYCSRVMNRVEGAFQFKLEDSHV